MFRPIAICLCRPPVQVDDILDQRQSDAQAARAPAGAGVNLPEHLEDTGHVDRVHANAIIRDGDDGHAFLGLQAYIDPSFWRSELDGVGDEVPNDLLNAYCISVNAGVG